MTRGWPSYVGAGILAAIGVLWVALSGADEGPADIETVAMILPGLTPEQEAGRSHFDANCADCHGPNASGSDQGPPLVHRIYEPGHHGDMAFLLAARQGVRAHHWRFGNMPAVDGVTEDEVIQITAYIRALQRANGIN